MDCLDNKIQPSVASKLVADFKVRLSGFWFYIALSYRALINMSFYFYQNVEIACVIACI